jgi:hypothetical protein
MTRRPAASMSHDASPDSFGEAVHLCQGYTPECSASGECARGGDCFTTEGQGFAKAKRSLERMIEAFRRKEGCRAREVAWLRCALEAIECQHMSGARAFDALRYYEIRRRIRAEYNAEKKRP